MYIYLNPRTGKLVLSADFDKSVEKALMPEETDTLIAFSSFSNAVKVYKYRNGSPKCVYETSLKVVSKNSIT